MSYTKEELIDLIKKNDNSDSKDYSDWSIEEVQELCINLNIPLTDDTIIVS